MTHRHPSQPPPSRTEADVSYVYAMVADVYTLRTGLHSMKVSGVLTRVQKDAGTSCAFMSRLVVSGWEIYDAVDSSSERGKVAWKAGRQAGSKGSRVAEWGTGTWPLASADLLFLVRNQR